jgi:hypothetical protein
MFAVGRELQELRSFEEMVRRNLLRKFWTKCHTLRNMPENVVWKMLHFGGDPNVSSRRQG